LSIGGDVELALRLQADGVHLGDAALVLAARRMLGNNALVGLSAHSVDDVRQAAEAGADYACLSPIFPTPSKPGYGPPLGSAAIAAAARLGIPIVALGGIRTSRVTECMAAGASAVAVMGEVMRAADPAQATAELLGAIEAVSGAGSLRAIG
ncbi:MAG: thiamine phosphate synthase, partial [Methylobacteriaceae bacterium]|nr:thiamine phosphate synthase [Methylobacteriaceae bacterium]